MQNLDVISINLLHIVISLCNLLILFLILKKFLYQPVKRMLAAREAALQKQYAAAAEAQQQADLSRKKWEDKLENAQNEADDILNKAAAAADLQSKKIVSDAKEKADGIMRNAEIQAELEHKKAQAKIRYEIVDVSAALTEKVLARKVSEEDHRSLIDSVISEIGEDHD